MIAICTQISFVLLVAALALAIFRLVKGPSLPDRVVALDTIGILSLGIIAVVTISSDNPVYLDVAIVMGLLAFMGTIAFARYLERVVGQ